MRLNDDCLIEKPKKETSGTVVQDRRRLSQPGLTSADGRVTLSVQCLNDACGWCMLPNCYCGCHDEAKARKEMALQLLEVYD